MKTATTSFGALFHAKRLATGLTLRQFCVKHGLDPGNISKLERGLLRPPEGREKLEQYARFLGLTPGSTDWYDFFDLAAAELGRIPEELMDNEEIVRKLPVLFRTLRGGQVDETVLDELVRVIRESRRA